MKNHTIQMRPSQFSPFDKRTTSSVQLKERRICPEGTIPMLRTKNKQELYMNFAEKDNMNFEYAQAYVNNDTFTAVSGDIYVWHVHAEPNEYSISMVGCELADGKKLNAMIFAGHGVFPGIYKDTQTRMFIGLANGAGSCLNRGCSSQFVQVDKNLYPGRIYRDDEYCRYGDLTRQPYMNVAVYRDPNLPRWWVSFAEKPVGYFTGEISNILECNIILWGGMVSNHGKKSQTPTQMGNGHFPSEGLGKTGVIAHALYNSKKKGGLSVGDPTGYIVSHPKCFDFEDLGAASNKPGHVFLYGGPGCRT